MARVYDIISRLENSNQKPIIKIDVDHEYKVNHSKAAAFKIKAIAEDDEIKDEEKGEQIIKVALGVEAFDYIESLELSNSAYGTVLNAIMAAVGDVTLEEVEEEAKKAQTPR